MTIQLSNSTHARETLVLGLPLIGSHLAQMALHVTDTVMVGWYGVVPLAAVVLGASSFFIVFVVGSGFAKAVLPMVSVMLSWMRGIAMTGLGFLGDRRKVTVRFRWRGPSW